MFAILEAMKLGLVSTNKENRAKRQSKAPVVARSSSVTQWAREVLDKVDEGGIPLCTASGVQEYAKVTYYSQEASIVAWEDKRLNENIGDIFIQYIDMDGNVLLSTEGEAICDHGANQIKPRVKADELGAYIVWEDSRNGPSDIFMQKHVLGTGQIFEDNVTFTIREFCEWCKTISEPKIDDILELHQDLITVESIVFSM